VIFGGVEDGLQPSAAIAVMGDLRRNHKLLLGRKKGDKLCNNQPLTASSTRYWPRSMQ
jgi:hypothetical protein